MQAKLSKRSLPESAYAETKRKALPTSFTLPRQQLIERGKDPDKVEEMTDKETWARNNAIFGGMRWGTMREIHAMNPTATTEWFANHPMSKECSDNVRRRMKK